MQGYLKVTNNWANVNSLEFKDINGKALTLGATVGDTLKLYDMSSYVLLWQGDTPTSTATLGTIPLAGNVIVGVSQNIFLKSVDGERHITVEIIKGA